MQPPIVLSGSNQKIVYIAAGDSTAVGQGASDAEHSYPYLVAEHIALQSAKTISYQNVAQGGAKTQDLIDSQLRQIIDADPDIITISIGANDLTHLHTNRSIIDNDQIIINTLLQQTHAQIYITDIPNFYAATLLPGWYRKLLEFKINSLNPKLKALAQNRVQVIDIHDFGWDQFSDLSTTISSDQFHPNDLGYKNWADAFITTMQSNGQ